MRRKGGSECQAVANDISINSATAAVVSGEDGVFALKEDFS